MAAHSSDGSSGSSRSGGSSGASRSGTSSGTSRSGSSGTRRCGGSFGVPGSGGISGFIPITYPPRGADKLPRQSHGELGVAGFAGHRDGSAMGTHHRRRDRQPEPGAAALAGPGGVAAGEPL